ncbi:hypothetical protein GOV11_03415 [Candidatus Woesearchaeota archaeon]|nr:hypothetical protein [Candidatus Woesearchaeota archaeon]
MAEVGALYEIGLMIIVASVLAFLARRLKQPLVFGYLLAGILLGPAAFGIIPDPGPFVWLSEMALVFLLFVIGLQLDFTRLKDVGRISVVIGVLQVGLTAALGMGAGLVLGLPTLTSVYFGLMAAFSSTILVSKLLDERREMNSLTGELAMGILIVQDIIAVFALALLGAFTQAEGFSSLALIVSPFLGGLNLLVTIALLVLMAATLFVLFTFVLFKWVMRPLYKTILGNNELLFVISLAVVFLLAGVAGFLKFSLAIGSFTAGMLLSSMPHSHEVVSRVRPLKDFFLTLFFVLLGLEVSFSGVESQAVLVAILVGFAFVIKPVLTFLLFKMFKYNNYTAFLTSLHLAQLGEFGLILVAGAAFSGALPLGFLSACVIALIATMVVSAYLIEYDRHLYSFFKPLLDPLERLFGTDPEEFKKVPDKYAPEVVVFGITPVSAEIIDALRDKKRILVVDFNPFRAGVYEKEGIPTICSDAIDTDLYESINFSSAEIVISVIHDTPDTLHGPSSNTYLIRQIRQVNKHAVLIVTASAEDEAERFYKAGATIVLTPTIMGKRLLKELISERDLSKLRGLGLVFYQELHDDVPFER